MPLNFAYGFLFTLTRTSIFKLSTIPDPFGVVLLSLTLILALSPYFSNTDFGLFKIPEFSLPVKNRLKVIGPILFGICVICFLPIIPDATSLATKNPSPSGNSTPLPNSNPEPSLKPTPSPNSNSIRTINPPNINTPIDAPPVRSKATGWIYVGTLIENQWRGESGGAGARPTLESSGSPIPPSIPEKGIYRVAAQVHLREALPTAPGWEMKATLGFIRQGSDVYIDKFELIEEKNWLWGHVTNILYK